MMTSRKYRCRSRNRRTPQGARYCPSGTVAINSVDPRTEVRRLDLPSRQKIEIARAISGNLRILLLDEPTASLSNRDVQWLGDVIERLKRSGTTVVLISHRMQEVRAFCSVLTIFRNGRTVGAHAMNDVADAEIIELMIGRSLGAAFPAKPVRADAEAVAPELGAIVPKSRDRGRRRHFIFVVCRRSAWTCRPGRHGAARSVPGAIRGH